MLCLTMRIAENEKNGILLACRKGHMRIALEDCADAVEVREVNGRWTLEDGTPVELDGVFTGGDTDLALFEAQPARELAEHGIAQARRLQVTAALRVSAGALEAQRAELRRDRREQ